MCGGRNASRSRSRRKRRYLKAVNVASRILLERNFDGSDFAQIEGDKRCWGVPARLDSRRRQRLEMHRSGLRWAPARRFRSGRALARLVHRHGALVVTPGQSNVVKLVLGVLAASMQVSWCTTRWIMDTDCSLLGLEAMRTVAQHHVFGLVGSFRAYGKAASDGHAECLRCRTYFIQQLIMSLHFCITWHVRTAVLYSGCRRTRCDWHHEACLDGRTVVLRLRWL